MCDEHWALVPPELKEELFNLYVPGTGFRKNPRMRELWLTARRIVQQREHR